MAVWQMRFKIKRCQMIPNKCSSKTITKTLQCPYVIYGDFECLTTLSNEGLTGLTLCNRTEHTKIVISQYNEEIRNEIMDKMNNPLPMEKLTDEEEKQFKECKQGHICGGSYTNTNEKRKFPPPLILQVNTEVVLIKNVIENLFQNL